MDRNTTIGLILIGLLLTVFTVMNRPTEEDIQQAKEQQKKSQVAPSVPQNTSSNAKAAPAVNVPNASAKKDSVSPSAPTVEKVVRLENKNLRIHFSSKGAMLQAVFLKKHKSYEAFKSKKNDPLCLFDAGDAANAVVLKNASALKTTQNVYFNVQELPNQVIFTYPISPQKSIKISYALKEDNRLTYDLDFPGFEPSELENASLDWAMSFRKTERKMSEQRRITTICYDQKESGLDYLSETSDDDAKAEEALNWVAYKQSYFSSILHPKQGFTQNSSFDIKNYTEGQAKDTTHIKAMKSSLGLQFNQNKASFTWYFGENDYKTLSAYQSNYDDILNYGWGLFRWINLYAVQPIFNLLIANGIGIGIAILLLTIVLKLILMPIQWKMFVSSVKMKILKPEIEQLNEKYPNKEDALKKQTEMMSLYKDSGASPLAGCVPMLIQMPILLAVFRFFPAAFELRQQPFLWAEDLSSYDSIWDFGFHVWGYGDHVSLFTLLMAGTTLWYTYMNSGNMQQPKQPGMPDMRVIMYIFPVLMIFFFNDFSSGLSYYYFISTLISIIIMVVIKRFFVDEEKLKVKMDERMAKAKVTPKKKSKFQERLEEMQRKSIEMQKNNKRK
ncbi:MAG: membrane protein insertase YidC [Flavobacteriales bacterium]